MEVKGAIFDMDGTLIDSLGAWDILWKKLKQYFDVKTEEFPSVADDKAVRTMLLADAMEKKHMYSRIQWWHLRRLLMQDF